MNTNQKDLFHYIEIETHEVCKKIQLNYEKADNFVQIKLWLLSIKDILNEVEKLFNDLNILLLFSPLEKMIYSLINWLYFISNHKIETQKKPIKLDQPSQNEEVHNKKI